jgi:hypothetical protein
VHSHVSTAVELESVSEPDSSLDVTLRLELCEGFLSSVETSYVSSVVLGVVKLHDLSADRGFQSLWCEQRQVVEKG